MLPTGNQLRIRCVDFDVQKRKWSHNREIFRLDQFVSSAADPTVLQLPDESLHYLWKVDEGEHQGEATGLYYQAETDGKTEKLSSAQEYRAIAVGNLIVVCYSMAESPEKVFFRNCVRHADCVVQSRAAKSVRVDAGTIRGAVEEGTAFVSAVSTAQQRTPQAQCASRGLSRSRASISRYGR